MKRPISLTAVGVFLFIFVCLFAQVLFRASQALLFPCYIFVCGPTFFLGLVRPPSAEVLLYTLLVPRATVRCFLALSFVCGHNVLLDPGSPPFSGVL